MAQQLSKSVLILFIEVRAWKIYLSFIERQRMKNLLILYRKALHEKSTCPLLKGRARKIYLSFIEGQSTKNPLVFYGTAGHERSTCPLSKGRAWKIYLSFIERQGMKNPLVLYRKAGHEKSKIYLSYHPAQWFMMQDKWKFWNINNFLVLPYL